MNGSFACDVNFDASSNQITNLNMSVSKGSYSATITGEKASFSSSHFNFSDVGTWKLNNGSGPMTPVRRKLHGSLYGPNAKHIGGAWGMEYDECNAAVGIFQGNR